MSISPSFSSVHINKWYLQVPTCWNQEIINHPFKFPRLSWICPDSLAVLPAEACCLSPLFFPQYECLHLSSGLQLQLLAHPSCCEAMYWSNDNFSAVATTTKVPHLPQHWYLLGEQWSLISPSHPWWNVDGFHLRQVLCRYSPLLSAHENKSHVRLRRQHFIAPLLPQLISSFCTSLWGKSLVEIVVVVNPWPPVTWL